MKSKKTNVNEEVALNIQGVALRLAPAVRAIGKAGLKVMALSVDLFGHAILTLEPLKVIRPPNGEAPRK